MERWQGRKEIGQTKINVEERVRAQLQGAPNLLNGGYKILFIKEAINMDGQEFKDHDLFKWLKRMGITRISGTEWFECTVPEVEKAFEFAYKNIPFTSLSHKQKNNVESRGDSYNKRVAQTERSKILRKDTIIRILKIIAYIFIFYKKKFVKKPTFLRVLCKMFEISNFFRNPP